MFCRCGGIGRRGGFKIHCLKRRAGSIPVIGTNLNYARETPPFSGVFLYLFVLLLIIRLMQNNAYKCTRFRYI